MARVVRAARLLVLTALVGAVGGCVAEMVRKQRPRKGPVAEVGYVDAGGGEVRYSQDGWGFVVAARRATALRRAAATCKPLRFKITDDFTRQDVDAPYNGDDLQSNLERGMEHYNVAPYRHIVFQCEK